METSLKKLNITKSTKMIKKFKKNLPILGILFLSLFFRLYKISAYMTFLGDEGRDALVWLRMIRFGKFTLIGPQTSIGNMYLGPLFYYLMMPFYFVFGTVGPSIGVAFLGGATTFLLWYAGKEWFSEKAGLLAAFFYAISPVAIVYSRSSWNPNVMPFFAILVVWGIWQFWQKNEFRWLALEGIFLSFAVQSHYLGLLLIPLAGIFWLIKLIELNKKKKKYLKKFIISSIVHSSLFIILTIVPLVWFDLRHNFINYQSFYKFFSERQTTVNFKIYKAIPNLWPLWKMLVTRLLAGKNETAGLLLAIVFVILLGRLIILKKKKLFGNRGLILILVWLGIGLLGMGLYKQHIYDHYFGFLYPAVFLFASFVSTTGCDRGSLRRYVELGIVGIILVFSLIETPLKYPPNYQMFRVIQVDAKIMAEAKDKPFNFALISKQNYEAGYEYFLEKWRAKLVAIEPQRFDETVTDQLFVVCEDPVCEPINHPKAQIANFGWSKIEKEWQFPWGVKLFKLVHVDQIKNEKTKL